MVEDFERKLEEEEVDVDVDVVEELEWKDEEGTTDVKILANEEVGIVVNLV